MWQPAEHQLDNLGDGYVRPSAMILPGKITLVSQKPCEICNDPRWLRSQFHGSGRCAVNWYIASTGDQKD